jgi:hypothetical protein
MEENNPSDANMEPNPLISPNPAVTQVPAPQPVQAPAQAPQPIHQHKSSNNSFLIILLIILLGTVAFLAYQNWQLRGQIALLQNTPTPSPIPTDSPVIIPTASPDANAPILSNPTAGEKVVSPLTITGTAPAAWMYQGTFPVKIIDSQSNLVAQGTAKETVKGSWKTEDPVNFSVTLPFSTTDSSGFLVLTANSSVSGTLSPQSIQVPINF